MCEENPQFDAPSQVRIAGSRTDSIYVLDTRHYAVHGNLAPGSLADASVVLDEGRLAVFRKEAGPVDRAAAVGPVYALRPGASLAVPTGRVLLRFVDGTHIDKVRTDIRAAGFDVEEILPYASNVAWVRPVSGGVCEALRTFPKLESLPGVVHVEPQMLMERSPR